MASEIKFSKPTISSTSSANYKLKILSSLAAQACTWNTATNHGSSNTDSSHETPLGRQSSSSSDVSGEDAMRKRDKKAVVKILQHRGEIYQNNFSQNTSTQQKVIPSLFGFNGRSILSVAFAKAFLS